MSIDDQKIYLPAFKVTQPIGSFYLALMSAQELTKIAYADMRRMETEQDPRREVERYLGIQRPLSEDRIRDLKRYVQGSDASFPASVILSIDLKCVEWNENDQVLTLKPYEANPDIPNDQSIPVARIAQILDGQHRVKGLEDWKPEKGTFELPVSIFVGADISTQSTIFATVNITQTKVRKSLVYDLFELAKARSPQKTSHDVAVALDETPDSPLYHRIKRLGVATEGRFNETLTQSVVVETLLPYLSGDPIVDRQQLLKGHPLKWPTPRESSKFIFRTLFIQKKDELIANAVWSYFDAVKKKWPEAWDNTSRGTLLARTNGFRAMMRLMRPIYYALNKKEGQIFDTDEVFEILKKASLNDNDFTIANFPPGTSGEAALFKRLLGELQLSTTPPSTS